MIKVDPHKTEILLCSCPANIPLNFAVHPWFVLNMKGALERWEVLLHTSSDKECWGHLYKNLYPPFQGIEILPFSSSFYWKAICHGRIAGESAEILAEQIKNSPLTYPFCYRYALAGPNSNTYVQWILNQCPEFKTSLPWNAFGKGFLPFPSPPP